VRIRFLQTCPSDCPDAPFQAGQVIDIADPSPDLLRLVDGVRAEVVPSDPIEQAVAPDLTRSEPERPRKGHRPNARHVVD
jgi:hypothetical protein